jgi:hypothetical protein
VKRVLNAEPEAIAAKVAPFGGFCWWCLQKCDGDDPHDPDTCTIAYDELDMSDWRKAKPKRSSSRSRSTKLKGRRQTTLSEKEQEEWRKRKEAVRGQRKRALLSAAKERCKAHVEALNEPIAGSGPFGSFTFYQKICIDFAARMSSHLSAEQLGRAKSKINNAALQIFTKLVKAAGLASLHAARTKQEATLTDFVALRERLNSSTERQSEMHAFLIHVREEERIKYGSIAEVKGLGKGASLLDMVAAVHKAAAPKRGRPPKEVSGDAGCGIEVAQNWADGGYTVDSMVARAQFDTRRINVSQKETQADVLAGASLVFTGIPSLLTLRSFKPRNRPLKISHATTARLHAMQLNHFHVQTAVDRTRLPLMLAVVRASLSSITLVAQVKMAKTRVKIWFPQWDEGSKRGVTAVMVGACGLLIDIDPESLYSLDDFYSDVLGFEILSCKTGQAVAEKLLAIFKRRGVNAYYFVGTDAVPSNIGYATGAIAYLRRDRKTPLIFALRCNGHIDMRAWKHGLEQTGTSATRSPIKRKADEATICAELLAIEDLYYIEKKWPAFGALMQERLPNGETNLKTSGCPDSRWTFWEELLRNKVGVTWIMGRLVRLWRQAVDAWMSEQGKELVDVEAVPLDEPLLQDRVPLRVVMVVIANDDFHRQLFDFTSMNYLDNSSALRFYELCDAYTGSWIRDDLDVAVQKLGGDGVREAIQEGGALHEDGATWDPPDDCPVSALTSEALPGLLLDITSKYMRVRMAVWEAIGSAYVMPYLHRKEMRYPVCPS